jgi:lysozyme family protein
MQSNFNRSLLLLLQHEGGYVNHPSDPGGMTNLGVTAKVWESWVGHPVDEKQMKALTSDDVAPLYKRKYWDACRADELVSGLDYAVFDCAVNSGVGRSVKLLQGCVGVTVDGGIGPATMAAVNQADPTSLIEDFSNARLNFLRALNTWSTFGRGWERRVNEVKVESLRMLG